MLTRDSAVSAVHPVPRSTPDIATLAARAVHWRDLVVLSRREALIEVTLSWPWLALCLCGFWLTQHVHWVWLGPALIAAFYLYLTGLRQAHNAFHLAVGISRQGCDLLLYFLSMVMTGSMHAVRLNHLHHHRYSMSDQDIEGFTGRLAWWQALLVGPYFPLRLHAFALRTAGRTQRRHILLELGANVAWAAFVTFMSLGSGQWWLGLFLITMLTAHCTTGFFAVWTVHHGTNPRVDVARTQRGRWRNLLTYQMFLHREHHLFPAVPTCHWAELGRRIDAAMPHWERKSVI